MSKLLEHNGECFSREVFISYLENTLIPDLKEAGREATAADFELAVRFMRDEDTRSMDGEKWSVPLNR